MTDSSAPPAAPADPAATQDRPLRLRACDTEDLQVIAAILQDAIIPVAEIAFDDQTRRFVMVVTRFRWERLGVTTDEGHPVFERINCAMHIDGVKAVRTQKLDFNKDHAAMLDLLTIMQSERDLLLVFAGGARLRLELDDWSIKLEDFGEAWPTPRCPDHTDTTGSDS